MTSCAIRMTKPLSASCCADRKNRLVAEYALRGLNQSIAVAAWRQGAIEEACAVNAWTLGKNDDLEFLEYVEISEVSRGNIASIATYSRGEEPSRARRRLRHGDTLATLRDTLLPKLLSGELSVGNAVLPSARK